MKFSALGHELDYEVIGTGRPCFLVHGLTVDREILKASCEPIFGKRPVKRIYVDLPGHGKSLANPERPSADDLVDVLGLFVSEMAGDEAPLLFGYSYGGYLAQGLLREHKYSGLMLVCPIVEPDFGRRHVPPRYVTISDENLAFSDDPTEREAFDEIAVRRTKAVLERFQKFVHPANISVDREFLAATRARYVMARPSSEAMRNFAAPVTIVCGRDDHWCGYADAMTLASAFHDCHYIVEPAAGHLLPLEVPEAFADALNRWLARV